VFRDLHLPTWEEESHFDRVKAKGSNFLVIDCLFSVDRIDQL
jgi:hypothetical protein